MEYGVIGQSEQPDTKDGLEELCPVCGDKVGWLQPPALGLLSPTFGLLSPNPGLLSPTLGLLPPTPGLLSPTPDLLFQYQYNCLNF